MKNKNHKKIIAGLILVFGILFFSSFALGYVFQAEEAHTIYNAFSGIKSDYSGLLIIVGENSDADELAASEGLASFIGEGIEIKTASQVTVEDNSRNQIIIGNSNVNSIVMRDYLPIWDYSEGESVIGLDDTDDNIKLIIAGTNSSDTQNTINVLMNYESNMERLNERAVLVAGGLIYGNVDVDVLRFIDFETVFVGSLTVNYLIVDVYKAPYEMTVEENVPEEFMIIGAGDGFIEGNKITWTFSSLDENYPNVDSVILNYTIISYVNNSYAFNGNINVKIPYFNEPIGGDSTINVVVPVTPTTFPPIIVGSLDVRAVVDPSDDGIDLSDVLVVLDNFGGAMSEGETFVYVDLGMVLTVLSNFGK